MAPKIPSGTCHRPRSGLCPETEGPFSYLGQRGLNWEPRGLHSILYQNSKFLFGFRESFYILIMVVVIRVYTFVKLCT